MVVASRNVISSFDYERTARGHPVLMLYPRLGVIVESADTLADSFLS